MKHPKEGSNAAPMISFLATVYLFLGGAGGGGVLVLSVLELLRLSRRTSTFAREIHPDSYARSWIMSLGCLLLGAFFLLMDLGRVDRMWMLFSSFAASPLVVGSFALAASSLVAASFSYFEAFDNVRWSRFFLRLLAGVGAVAGFTTIVYTGVLLWMMPSVAAWQTPLLPVLFALSSCSCGIVTIMGSYLLANDRVLSWRAQRALVRIDTLLVFCELLVVALFVARLFADERCVAGGTALLWGGESPLFWVGFVGLGLLVPLVLEQMNVIRRKLYLLLWIVGCVFVGAFALRLWVVGLAAFDPASSLGPACVQQLGLCVLG